MGYQKTDWQDTLRDSKGEIIQRGTPLNAQALSKIEEGIVQTEQKIDTEIEKVTTQLAHTVSKGETYVHLKEFGAVGDYYLADGTVNPNPTDNSAAIQAAFDYLYENGGGTLDIGYSTYAHLTPLVAKTISNQGNYDQPPIKIRGQIARRSAIIKIGGAVINDSVKSYKNLDASVIVVNGIDENIDTSFTAIFFENVVIENKSTATITYAVYAKKGSRLIANYSAFRVVKDSSNLESHDRYALYTHDVWTTNIKDCTFIGDYGFYNGSAGTSLLLENTFVSTSKIGYQIRTTYSALINTCADDCVGVVYDFQYGSVNAVSLGAESPNADIQIRAFNTNLIIGSAFLYIGTVENSRVFHQNGSNVVVDKLELVMPSSDAEYLARMGTNSTLLVKSMSFSPAGSTNSRFLKTEEANAMANNTHLEIIPDRNALLLPAVQVLGNTAQYRDWYMKTPKYINQRIVMGFKKPNVLSDDINAEWSTGHRTGDIYLSSDPLQNYLGWKRSSQTSTTSRDGSNKIIPLVLVGTTAQRPTENLYNGLEYKDTTLKKTVTWYGTGWFDENGTQV